MSYKLILLSFIFFVSTFGGCSNFFQEKPQITKLSDILGQQRGVREVEIKVSRSRLADTVAIPDLLRVRMVPLIKSETGSDTLPEYRLFDLRKGSPYEILGLKDSDILVAANDYVIYSPEKFPAFVQIITRQKEAFIDIRRDGIPIRLVYNFQ